MQRIDQGRNCIRLAWMKVELGGHFYLERPQRCMDWALTDAWARQLLKQSPTYCAR